MSGGGILVNVPDPARFAFHKLIVAGERGASLHAKRDKDLHQAAQVFNVLVQERPDDVRLSWEEGGLRGSCYSPLFSRCMPSTRGCHA